MVSEYNDKVIFDLEIILQDAAHLSFSACEYPKGQEPTARHYITRTFARKETETVCREIVHTLDDMNQSTSLTDEDLKQLERIGHQLYNVLFPPEIKTALKFTEARYIIFHLDDHLVHIPWEMIHDGQNFLCLRFNAGRIVKMRQYIPPQPHRRLSDPLRMLVLSDPKGNLESSYREGEVLRRRFSEENRIISVETKTFKVTRRYVQSHLKEYDIVHYCGHADYDPQDKGRCGWVLSDAYFTPKDIHDMAGGECAFPCLIFANGCKTGYIETWDCAEKQASEAFDLVNAFLLAGVRHYIGTLWEIVDQSDHSGFCTTFYESLYSGEPVGEALRKSRMAYGPQSGQKSIFWISYILYGDPTFSYIRNESAMLNEPKKPDTVQEQQAILTRAPKQGDTRSTKPFNIKFYLYPLLLLFAIALGIIGPFLYKRNQPLHMQSIDRHGESRDRSEHTGKMFDLLDRLDEKYIERKKEWDERNTEEDASRAHSSGPISLLLITSPESTSEKKIFDALTRNLLEYNSIKILERERFEDILQELYLLFSSISGSSTDPGLRARLREARYILYMEGMKVKEGDLCRMRLFDTHTSEVRMIDEWFIDSEKSLEEQAESQARKITEYF
ncbi:MAG: CHAT domain-containing protein [bacterium]